MKIFVFSDIHGRKTAMKRIKNIIDTEKPDRIFFLGDFLYNGPRNGVPSDYDGMAVAEMLRPYLTNSLFVKGNCDAAVDDMVLGVTLPKRVEITLSKHRCVLAHGDDLDPSFLRLEEGDIFFSGHTHVWVLKKENGIICVNPGSPSFPKENTEPSFASFSEKTIAIHRLSDCSVIASMDI